MTKHLIPVFVPAVLLLLSACSHVESSVEAPHTVLTPVANEKDENLPEFGEDCFRRIVEALRKKDYAGFLENYVEEYKIRLKQPVFEEMAADFNARNGELSELKYLGSVSKYTCRVLLWRAVFKRTPALEEKIRLSGKDPAAVPESEMLVQMMLGKTDAGEWRIVSMSIN